MEYHSILDNVAKHIALTPDETQPFVSLLSFKKVGRNESLLKAGEAGNTINYVRAGALRAYYLDAE